MAIEIVGTTGGQNTSEASFSVPIPTHQAGDWLLVFFSTEQAPLPSGVTAGWTQVVRNTYTDGSAYLYALKATAAGHTLSIDANERVAWAVIVVRGLDVADTTALASLITTATANSASAAFASRSGLNASIEYISIVAQTGEGGDKVILAAPTGWSNYQMFRTGTTGSHAGIARASRIFTGLTTVSPPATAMEDSGVYFTYHLVLPGVSGPPTFTGSGGVTAPLAVVAGSGSHTQPTDTGSGAGVAPAATLAGAGAFTKPTYTGSGAPTAPKPTLAGSGLAGQVFSGSGAVVAPKPTLSGAGDVPPYRVGAGAVVAPSPTAAAAGTHSKPVFSAGGVLSTAIRHMTVPGDLLDLNITTGITMLVVARQHTLGAEAVAYDVAPGVGGAGRLFLGYHGTTNVWRGVSFLHAGAQVAITSTVPADTDFHAVALREDSDSIELYVDGVQRNSVAMTAIVNPVTRVRFGSDNTGGRTYPAELLAHLYIWDRALTNQEMAAASMEALTGAILQAPAADIDGTGTHSIRSGAGDLQGPTPDVDGTGKFTPVFPASGALQAPTPDVAGVGRHFRSTGALEAPMPELDGVAINTKPYFGGAAHVQPPKPTLAGAITYTEVDAIIQQPMLDAEDILYGDRTTSYRWEVLEHSNGVDLLIGTLDGVADASLKWQNNAAVKGAGNASIIDLDEAAPGMMRIGELPLESIRLRPVQIISGLPENPLGVYLLSNAKEEWEATGRVWDIELLDRTTVPQQDVVDESYAVPAGTLILNEVAVILASCGEYIALNEASTLATSNGMAWEAGTSKLKIINDLLDVAGYNSLWMDGYGNFRMTPRVLPADRSITYDLLGVPREMRDGERAIYQPDWTRERDSFSVPNKVIAVQAAGGEDETALVGQWTNEDNTSPYSYPVRGRWIPHVLDSVETPEGTEAEILAFLQARARATLVAMSAVQAQVKISHLPIPVRVSEVIRFSHKKAGIDTKHVINAIELELRATGLMKSTLQEVISL